MSAFVDLDKKYENLFLAGLFGLCTAVLLFLGNHTEMLIYLREVRDKLKREFLSNSA